MRNDVDVTWFLLSFLHSISARLLRTVHKKMYHESYQEETEIRQWQSFRGKFLCCISSRGKRKVPSSYIAFFFLSLIAECLNKAHETDYTKFTREPAHDSSYLYYVFFVVFSSKKNKKRNRWESKREKYETRKKSNRPLWRARVKQNGESEEQIVKNHEKLRRVIVTGWNTEQSEVFKLLDKFLYLYLIMCIYIKKDWRRKGGGNNEK